MLKEFGSNLPHCQTSHISVSHQVAKFIEKTGHNVLKPRPL
jgi:hypothetical protein